MQDCHDLIDGMGDAGTFVVFERSIAAGQDFAIMGFDGLLDTAHSNPPLSTVNIRPGALGEAAASLMLERLSKPDAGRLRYLATPELLLRASA